MKRPWWAILTLSGLCLVGTVAVDGDEPGAAAAEMVRLLDDLDADLFAIRTRALERLHVLAADGEQQSELSRLVEQALIDPETSFEVRKQLERLRQVLPAAELPPSEGIELEQITELIGQLEDDSYARRLGAESRLRWLLKTPAAVLPIYEEVKRRLLSGDLPAESAQCLKTIYGEARQAWIESDPAGWELAPVADEEIARWVDGVVEPTEWLGLIDEPTAAVYLRDLMVRPEYVARVRAALEARLERDDLAAEAKQRLTELVELTRPSMVAEFWQGRQHLGIQWLVVGVPSLSEAGTSHFDRIDDRTAHCVEGVNLSEGDYPVGVAIPHPTHSSAVFHLVNLPTPRRRMIYEYQVEAAEEARYQALVRRTLDRILSEKRPLDEQGLHMVKQFEPKAVSRFVGRYLLAVEDRPVAPDVPGVADVHLADPQPGAAGGASVHGQLCKWLALRGTVEAVPELLEAIDGERVPPIVDMGSLRYRFDRLAALAIAGREPWPEVDAWLARMVPRDEVLLEERPDAPQTGATAAGLLLSRHGATAEEFGLIASPNAFTRLYGVTGYRYGAEAAAGEVSRWWEERTKEQPE